MVKSLQIGLKKLIGRLLGADLSQTHIFDQAVLESFEGSFNPSLGLRRAGINELDSQLLQDPGKLGERLVASEHFFDRGLSGRLVDTMIDCRPPV